MAAARLETAGAWEQAAGTGDEVREIIGAGDETFLEQMRRVVMDLRTGDRRREAVAEDRPDATWKAVVAERLPALGTGGRSLVSDRAKALIQLADPGLEGLRMPDFLPGRHALGKGAALSLARHVRPARQELKKAAEVLRKPMGPEGRPQAAAEAQHHGEGRRAAGQRWEGGHRPDRHHLETLSRTRHPGHLHDSRPHTSAQVHNRVHADVAAMET